MATKKFLEDGDAVMFDDRENDRTLVMNKYEQRFWICNKTGERYPYIDIYRFHGEGREQPRSVADGVDSPFWEE